MFYSLKKLEFFQSQIVQMGLKNNNNKKKIQFASTA